MIPMSATLRYRRDGRAKPWVVTVHQPGRARYSRTFETEGKAKGYAEALNAKHEACGAWLQDGKLLDSYEISEELSQIDQSYRGLADSDKVGEVRRDVDGNWIPTVSGLVVAGLYWTQSEIDEAKAEAEKTIKTLGWVAAAGSG